MMIDKDMLEAIGQIMDSKLGKALEPIHSDIRTMKNDIQSLKADNAKLITLEKKVDLLLEGQQGMNEKFSKLDQVAEDVEEIKIKVSALEEVSRSQASQIREIRLAK